MSSVSHAKVVQSQRPASVTVGTQNLYHWMTEYEIRLGHMDQEIQSGIPHVIGFQEAAQWKDGRSLYNEFIKRTNYISQHKVTNSYGIMQEGIGIASVMPGQNCQDSELPATSFNSRQYINVCDFKTDIGMITVINAHTSPGPWATKKRTQQVQFIVDLIKQKKTGYPILIMGDLNDVYSTESLEPLKKMGYHDVLEGEGSTYVHKENPYVTYPRNVRLDYIFYHPDQLHLAYAGFMFKQNIISDHYGLKAVFWKL